MDVTVEEAIDFGDDREIESTGYKPCEIKDITDENIIETVIANIIKYMRRKVKFNKKVLKNSMLLINPEIKFQ